MISSGSGLGHSAIELRIDWSGFCGSPKHVGAHDRLENSAPVQQNADTQNAAPIQPPAVPTP